MENKKVISLSLIILFLSLSIVYSLAYMKRSDLFKGNINTSSENLNSTWTNDTSSKSSTNLNENSISLWNYESSTTSIDLWDSKQSWVNGSNIQSPSITEPTTSVSLTSTNLKMLPGTSEYFWELDIVSILWEKPKFTLQDSKWNFFAYYWEHLNFAQTVKTLGWNIYEMVTEREILQNQLFGDKVSYINLSAFKDIRVIMVIEIDGDVWLLQIPADQYHQSKDYLKSLFIQ